MCQFLEIDAYWPIVARWSIYILISSKIVFYIEDEIQKGWLHVVKNKPRDLFDLGDSLPVEVEGEGGLDWSCLFFLLFLFVFVFVFYWFHLLNILFYFQSSNYVLCVLSYDAYCIVFSNIIYFLSCLVNWVLYIFLAVDTLVVAILDTFKLD